MISLNRKPYAPTMDQHKELAVLHLQRVERCIAYNWYAGFDKDEAAYHMVEWWKSVQA